MQRKFFDVIASAIGVGMVIVLVVAGALGLWGYSYANSNVHNQLAEQQIFFPPKAAFAHAKAGTEITPAMRTTIEPYAGQQLLTGPQAEAWANDFIAVHLSEMPYHGVYAAISTAARAHPTDAKLAALEQTSFQGTTLRGLLLEAYGFWTFGQIALYAAICSFVMAGVIAILAGIGFWHARRQDPEAEVTVGGHDKGELVKAA